ncbi:hypothetical protein [Gordonia sp. (in: high G+C Gram-positive bacteria)]|uniref:hypothetical protein n=1 Tax=Gordonia sp. (in: high G+C Gram-positive bacteria) TaxID=84139 RepID=UPI003C7132D4
MTTHASPQEYERLARDLMAKAGACDELRNRFQDRVAAVKPLSDQCNRLVRGTATGDDLQMLNTLNALVKAANDGMARAAAAAAELKRQAQAARARAQQAAREQSEQRQRGGGHR